MERDKNRLLSPTLRMEGLSTEKDTLERREIITVRGQSYGCSSRDIGLASYSNNLST